MTPFSIFTLLNHSNEQDLIKGVRIYIRGSWRNSMSKSTSGNPKGLSKAEQIISTWPAHLQIPQYLPNDGLPKPTREISDEEAERLWELIDPYKNW